MKVLIISGSRSDRNGLDAVAEELKARGCDYHLLDLSTGTKVIDRWSQAIDFAGAVLDEMSFKLRPAVGQIALLAGDRYETLAAAFACSMAGVPIAHIAGGDVTEGSRDDRYRNAITCLASLHFATNDRARGNLSYWLHRNLVRGSDIVVQTGSPALDWISKTPIKPREEILPGPLPCVLISIHPDTVDYKHEIESRIVAGLFQLATQINVVWIGPNADVGGKIIEQLAAAFCTQFPSSRYYRTVDRSTYYSLMTHCSVMLGNSSAGLYEAPSFGLPVVNVGDRQKGRVMPANVLQCGVDADEIARKTMAMIQGGRVLCVNPYGDGKSAPRIVDAIESLFACDPNAILGTGPFP